MVTGDYNYVLYGARGSIHPIETILDFLDRAAKAHVTGVHEDIAARHCYLIVKGVSVGNEYKAHV